MSDFFGKLFALFQSKSQKMLYLHCVVKLQSRKLDYALTWYKNAIPELRCASTESRSLRKLRCASDIKKIQLRILRCAFTG